MIFCATTLVAASSIIFKFSALQTLSSAPDISPPRLGGVRARGTGRSVSDLRARALGDDFLAVRDRHCAYQNKVAILVFRARFSWPRASGDAVRWLGLIRPFAVLSRIDRLLLQPHFITSQHDGYDLGGPETVPESDWDQRGNRGARIDPLRQTPIIGTMRPASWARRLTRLLAGQLRHGGRCVEGATS
jgi:hypothetical protein